MIAKGQAAPLFVAPGTEGEVDVASLLAEGPVVLYFFPKAFTPG